MLTTDSQKREEKENRNIDEETVSGQRARKKEGGHRHGDIDAKT